MLDRRQFVRTIGLGAITGAGIGAVGPQIAAAAQSEGNKDNSKIARLLPGNCAYSYGREMGYVNGKVRPGKMTLEDVILKAVEQQIVSVDVTVYYLTSTDPAYLQSLRLLAYKHGVAFSGTGCRSSMVQATADQRADVLNEIKQWVDVTEQLGASHLRVFAGKLPEGATVPEGVNWVVDGMKALCDYSGKKGIVLGVEDHQGVTQTADVCIEIMQRVNHPYASINLDITNFIPTPTQDAYAQIAACLPYSSGNIHIRDHFYGPAHAPVDMERVWKLFAQAGYQGYVSAEYEANYPGSAAPSVAVPQLLDTIKTLCKKYSSV
jgi:sugar phosphate isomerase/epimerase